MLVENSVAAGPLGSLAPFDSAHSSHGFRYDLVCRCHCLRQMHGSFHSLHLQHNINSLLVYWLTGNFSQGPVLCYQFFCYRARLARSDNAAINLHYGDYFSAGAGEKTFVSVKEIVTRQIRLADLQTGFYGHFHDDFASDSVESAG